MKISVSTLICTMFFASAALCAATPDKGKIEPPKHHRPPMMGHPGQRPPDIWRAFSQLPPGEQRQLMLIQRSEPEKFRQIMVEKARKLQEQHRARRQMIQKLAADIRECKDKAAADTMRAKLKAMVKEDFDKRINHLRRNVEMNKKRLAWMEKELEKRQSNAEAIIEAITGNIISGKIEKRKKTVTVP